MRLPLVVNHNGGQSIAHSAESDEGEAFCQMKSKILLKQGKMDEGKRQAATCQSSDLKDRAEKMSGLSEEEKFSEFSIIDKMVLERGGNAGAGHRGYGANACLPAWPTLVCVIRAYILSLSEAICRSWSVSQGYGSGGAPPLCVSSR